MNPIAHAILRRLYELDAEGVETALAPFGLSITALLESQLEFVSWDTGGGCMMLIANLTQDGDYRIGISDGDEKLPKDSETFWFGILKEDNSELYSIFVTNGKITSY